MPFSNYKSRRRDAHRRRKKGTEKGRAHWTGGEEKKREEKLGGRQGEKA